LALISLAISPVVQTLSNAHSVSRNNVTVALLLKPWVMRFAFRSSACVVECTLFNTILVVSDNFQFPKLEVQFFQNYFLEKFT
jgi:hypothetical protein